MSNQRNSGTTNQTRGNKFYFVYNILGACLSQDPLELKRVTRVKPIDSFSARWDSIVERLLGTKEQQQQQQQKSQKDGGESREGTVAAPSSTSSGTSAPRDSSKLLRATKERTHFMSAHFFKFCKQWCRFFFLDERERIVLGESSFCTLAANLLVRERVTIAAAVYHLKIVCALE